MRGAVLAVPRCFFRLRGAALPFLKAGFKAAAFFLQHVEYQKENKKAFADSMMRWKMTFPRRRRMMVCPREGARKAGFMKKQVRLPAKGKRTYPGRTLPVRKRTLRPLQRALRAEGLTFLSPKREVRHRILVVSCPCSLPGPCRSVPCAGKSARTVRRGRSRAWFPR